MPAYEIFYMDSYGALADRFSATCEDDEQAKFLACAMKLPSCHYFEVWNGGSLIYKRTQNWTVCSFGVRNGLPHPR